MVQRVIAIDPGVNACAWACGGALGLVNVGFKRGNVQALHDAFVHIGELWAPTLVVVEHPVVYAIKKAHGDPNDIVRLAYIAGVVGGACAASSEHYCALESTTPRAWKGSVPKDIHNERTRQRCPQAIPLIDTLPKSNQNHVWDAVGLLLWRLERIN
jgi:hypothetical protein